MIDPKFMDEQLGINREEIAKRYRQLQEEQNQEDEKIKAEIYYPYEDMEEVEQQEERQEEHPPRLSRPGKAHADDKPIFEGGPLESEILAWKKQFGRIFMTDINGEFYIWRPLTRFEYKEIMSVPNTNPLMREEMICEVCVLFPRNYTYEAMSNKPGGIPSLLAEQIMEKSGFTRSVRVVEL